MTDTFLDALKQVTSLDEQNGTSANGVQFRIKGRGAMVLTHDAVSITIPAELGRDAAGKRGWHLYPDGSDPEVQKEAVRIISQALEQQGYRVWIGDSA